MRLLPTHRPGARRSARTRFLHLNLAASFCFVTMWFGAALLSAAERQAPQTTLGQLRCSGPVTYQTGVGPWIRHAHGECLVALPLSVKTEQRRCRIVIGSDAAFHVKPDAQIQLTRSDEGALSICVEKGTVFYAIPEKGHLTITNSLCGLTAIAGNGALEPSQSAPFTPVLPIRSGLDSIPKTDVSEPTSAWENGTHLGIVKVTGANSVELYNCRGRLVYRQEAEGRPSSDSAETAFASVASSNDDAGAYGTDSGSKEVRGRPSDFFEWQELPDFSFIQMAPDAEADSEVRNAPVENIQTRLVRPKIVRAPFGVQGSRNMMFVPKAAPGGVGERNLEWYNNGDDGGNDQGDDDDDDQGDDDDDDRPPKSPHRPKPPKPKPPHH